jgi:D-inositol-3-phosphate glycosyltransferase
MAGTAFRPRLRITILTAGRDPHYALGLLEALLSRSLQIEFVANDEMSESPWAAAAGVDYYNLRGDQSEEVSFCRRATRLIVYYLKLLRYTATTRSELFHILWPNKFEWLDNTLLLLWYRLLRKRIVYTAHNVSTGQRDGAETILNKLSLRFLYNNVDHIFVHSEEMKRQLVMQFGTRSDRVTVLPFPVNDVTPRSAMTRTEARAAVNIPVDRKTLLFFGNIAPYKGLDVLVEALQRLPECLLVIAGRVKTSTEHWRGIQTFIDRAGLGARVLQHIRYVREEEVEVYFKAADVLIAPYRRVDQSGVVFLSYSFGLPVIASDAGGLAEAIRDDVTGHLFRSGDSEDLVEKIHTYFSSDLFKNLEQRRSLIRQIVQERHSWKTAGDTVHDVYLQTTGRTGRWAGSGIANSPLVE